MAPTLVCCFSTNQGGMELMSFELSNLLAPLGDVALVCRAESFIHKKYANYQVSCPVIGIPFRGNFSFKLIKELKKIISDRKIKNVIFLGASELKSLYFACQNRDINFVNFHGTTKTHSKKDILHRILYRIVNTHVTVSDHIQKNVRKIIPVYNHTNIKTIYTPKEGAGQPVEKPQGPFQCLLTGRVAGGKGHMDAIEACEYAFQMGVDLELNFLGNIEDQTLYQALLKRLSVSPIKDRCHFLGHQSQVASYYQKAHFLIFPSSGEGLPAVLLEAFQYGVLPVTYDNTVFPEFLKMGFQFPQVTDQSVEDLKLIFLNALMNYKDWKNSIEENYRLSFKLFSKQKIREDYASILK